MRAQKLLYVFARRYQMISACMTVSVRELRTAVREWACCILMTPNYGKRFHSKHKQCRPDQTASPEANCSDSAVY